MTTGTWEHRPVSFGPTIRCSGINVASRGHSLMMNTTAHDGKMTMSCAGFITCDKSCSCCYHCGDLIRCPICIRLRHPHCYDYDSVYDGDCHGDGSTFNAVHGASYYHLFDAD